MRGVGRIAVVLAIVVGTSGLLRAGQTKPAVTANPVLVFETLKGTFEIELFQSEAPKSVEHILGLMNRNNFYRAQRIHRVTAGLVQFGDPQSRDMSKQASWGTASSGRTIGVFELSKKRSHVRGAVGLGHSGNPAYADSQMYIMKNSQPSLDGKYAIIGRVTTGMAVIDKLVVTDIIKDARIK